MPFSLPFLFSHSTCVGLYFRIMSPFSLSYSHGSTMTISFSLTQSFLFILPGILHILFLPSRHLTYILLPPGRCSTIPVTSLRRGSAWAAVGCMSDALTARKGYAGFKAG